ncbi:uncharacterized protein EV422DRAFT_564970 [Fimicolochytrium jonesii]|uniref:uncharacterized protein n=1 Tax=Fimicolochytrium jonesii TaxID=1396493 RepID=UPI0022FEDE8B|nr:uncharacterized protein EV422DRAFT_564970 [Fimicolochytrium jonesii]KAI8824272.1 hypothetical protein EV422DRAFT_564970 [Fimicolochytrium jonesii]
MTADDELPALLRLRNKKRGQLTTHFNGKDWDIWELKRTALAKTSITRMTHSFTAVIESTQLDDFFIKGAHYIRWFIRTLVLEKSQSNNPLGLADHQQTKPLGLSEAAKAMLFGGQELTLENCRQGRESALRQFGHSYCFLLLYVSKNSGEPAKERTYFEYIYLFAKEIINTMLSLPSFATAVNRHLELFFRSRLFQNHQTPEPTGVAEKSDQSIAKVLGTGRRLSAHPKGFEKPRKSVLPEANTEQVLGQILGLTTQLRKPVLHPSREQTLMNAPSSKGDKGVRPALHNRGKGSAGATRTSKSNVNTAWVTRPIAKASAKVNEPEGRGTSIPPTGGWATVDATQMNDTVAAARLTTSEDDTEENGLRQDMAASDDEPEERSRPIRSAAMKEKERLRRRKVRINDVRMARSPLADAVLPPPQRFLFIHTRSSAIGSIATL